MIDIDSFDWPKSFNDLKKIFGKEQFLPDFDAGIQGFDQFRKPKLVRIGETDYCLDSFQPADEPQALYPYNKALKACGTDPSQRIILTAEEMRRLRRHA